MGKRTDLQALLEATLGSRNVYFQPPPTIKMQYDAIRYVRKSIDNTFADDSVYKQDQAYELTVMYRDPDSDLPMRISRLPKCSFDRHYAVDNLNHDVFTLYY